MASNEAVSGLTSFKNRLLFRSKPRARTYIMPTGFGYTFGIVGIVLFFLAVGYSNNLIYIFLFYLISMALTAMVITNRNVDAIEMTQIQSTGLFAEETGSVLVGVKNSWGKSSWDYEVFFHKSLEFTLEKTIPGGEEELIEVPFVPNRRGETVLPRLIIQSKFPLGLFRAWKTYRNSPSILVYPARKGTPDFPTSATNSENQNNVGLFRDHRFFQSSDPVRRIDWRASARRQDLLVKNFEENETPSLSFSWKQTEFLEDFEKRLSQLCLWIDEAEKHGHEYSLELGSFKSAFAKGVAHHRICLEALARIKAGDL